MSATDPEAGFESWLANAMERSEAWDSRDFDRLHALDRESTTSTPEVTAARVTRFCESAGEWIDAFGPNRAGGLVWYLMGVGEQVWWEIVEASPAAATRAVLALKSLYAVFASHLTDPIHGTEEVSDPLGGACYMLWDMGGGLESIPMFDKPAHLVAPCFDVLEHALSLNSPACWQSALHGLGHIQFSRQDSRARDIIDAFLGSRSSSVPEHLRLYAAAARQGHVQ